MISFRLSCEKDHLFDAWFRNSDDFEKQAERGLVECPHCGSHNVSKALMAPAVSTSGEKEGMSLVRGDEQKKVMAKLAELARTVRENAEDVGTRFAEEARKIHYGETDPRGIYGKATADEAKNLAKEGVDFFPLPPLPEDHN
jgi:hypothetical protein